MEPIRVELTNDDIYHALIQQARLYSGLIGRQFAKDFKAHLNIVVLDTAGHLAATVSFIALEQRPTHEITFHSPDRDGSRERTQDQP